jgi:hypothetical protein
MASAYESASQGLERAYNRSRDEGEAAVVVCRCIEAARDAADGDAWRSAYSTAIVAAHAEGTAAARSVAGPKYRSRKAYGDAETKGRAETYRRQSTLLRCIFGNPFRPAALDPAWLRRNDGTAAKLAQAVYEERRFADLPILADALEEAGCTDAAILAHCREPGDHVRGCWVVDLLLGKA